MKQILAIILCALLGLTVKAQNVKELPETKWGWKIGVQTYTFKEFDFCETLDKIDSTGAKYIECHTNMLIGGGLEGKMDYKMDEAKKKEVLSWLEKKGLKINNMTEIDPNKNPGAKSSKPTREVLTRRV